MGRAKSLKNEGQKFPIMLWKRNSGEIVVISGWSRLAAMKQLGWDKAYAIVIPESDLPTGQAGMSEAEALRLNFIENLLHNPMSKPDLIAASKTLRDKGMTYVDIGKAMGKSEGQIRSYLIVCRCTS